MLSSVKNKSVAGASETTDNNIPDRRSEIDSLIAGNQYSDAAQGLARLWRMESSSASAAFAVSRWERLRGKISLTPYRLAILRSFTVEPAVPLLRAMAFDAGVDLSVHVGDFNAFAQEILDPESSLYRFAPQAVILAAQAADLAADLWRENADMPAKAIEDAHKRVSANMVQWITTLRDRRDAALIIHTLEQPIRPALGILECQLQTGASEAIRQINQEISRSARKMRGVYVLDYDELVARHGRIQWHDDRKWLTARMPIAANQLINLSREWWRFLAALTGRTVKVLAVDLDNTLWGGIIGEDGMTGIKLGAESPGAAYQALQRAMLDLARRGILLAICSKNNPDDAMEALEKHPGMLLRRKDFAAIRISWDDKAQGLREIAAELNMGIDSIAFLDDSPFEREQVRAELPEVTILDLPDDPLQYAAVVRDQPVFERLSLSAEDQQRTVFYAQQRERAQVEHSFQSKEDFFRSLQQEAEIAPLSPMTLSRISQLTQKTNQFNVTTRRYAELQIAAFAAQPGSEVLSLRVRDRFGDHGLVGVAITRDEGTACEIDTFLLSCRVIGRTVETALLAHLADSAARRGCKQLIGWFFPTAKNGPASEFYLKHGFELAKQNGQGSMWTFDLTRNRITAPEWIKVTVTNGGHD